VYDARVSDPLAAPPAVTLGELFWNFFRVAVRGFGGGLPWARRMLVDERRWLTSQEFTNALSLCQLLPGANTLNVSVVVGTRFQGARGALAAVAGLTIVPLAIVLTLGALYAQLGDILIVNAMLRGVGPAAAGLIVATGVRMAAPPRPPTANVGVPGRRLHRSGPPSLAARPVLLGLDDGR
jgi:chromate transporter